MKRSTLFMLALAAFFACEDDYGSNKHMVSWGNFETDLNGEPWKYPIWEQVRTISGIKQNRPACEFTHLAISWRWFDGKYSPDGAYSSHLVFSQFPLLSGTYDLKARTFDDCDSDGSVESYFSLMFGDAGGDHYKLLETEENFFKIDSYNPESKIISGSFRASYVNENIPGRNTWYPDTLRFTNGKFRTKIFD
jgi:hypothetical protein